MHGDDGTHAVSRARGLNARQLAAIGEVAKLSERSELVVQLRGGLDGSILATVRDRWTVQHYRIDTHGTLTRPVAAGTRAPEVVRV